MGEWFIDWFNTPEYLEVYRHRNSDDAEKLFALICDNIELRSGMDVLDMACGTGRYSILFARLGCNVTAFDYSDLLLCEARRMAQEEGVKIEFYKADIRNFSFDRDFDIAVNLFTSFGYFERDEQNFNVLVSAYAHLKNGGTFILDYFNPEYISCNLVKRSEDIISNSEVVQERCIEKNRVKKKITIRKNSDTELYYEDVRLYSYAELSDMFNRAGFVIKKVFGNYSGSSFDILNSPRVIIIAVK